VATLPPPELDDGAEPELKPLEFDELEFDVPELLEVPELLDELELLPAELEEPDEFDEPEEFDEFEELELPEEPVAVLALCVDPGSTRATTPAVATLASPTAVVVERTLALPRSLAATARKILSRFMRPILGVSSRKPLQASSQPAMSRPGRPGNASQEPAEGKGSQRT
jgi:hypothetical protein